MVYVALVIDAYSRRILGWRTATSMRTSLVLDTLSDVAVTWTALSGATAVVALVAPDLLH